MRATSPIPETAAPTSSDRAGIYLVVEGMKPRLGVKDAVTDSCKRIATTSIPRPQAAVSRRQDDLQRVVLCREQGGQVLRRLHLSRRRG